LPSSLPFGKAGDLQILRCQGFAVVHYSVTLSVSSLKTSGFCNVRVYVVMSGPHLAVTILTCRVNT
jgi:hypothetical protein